MHTRTVRARGQVLGEDLVALHAALPAGSRSALVPGAGHALQLEQPDQALELVEEWIA